MLHLGNVARERVEESTRDGADEALNHIVGFNVSTASGADEAADRALTTVARKLDKSLSVEFMLSSSRIASVHRTSASG